MTGTDGDLALTAEKALEVLIDLVLGEGEEVFRVDWDSGAPGVGAGSEIVYELRGLYFAALDEGWLGPCEDLEVLLEDERLSTLTGATIRIESSRIGAAEIVELLEVQLQEPHELEINGTLFRAAPHGEISASDAV